MLDKKCNFAFSISKIDEKSGGGLNLERLTNVSVERPIFRKFEIMTIKSNRKFVIRFFYFRHLFFHFLKLFEHSKIFNNFFYCFF